MRFWRLRSLRERVPLVSVLPHLSNTGMEPQPALGYGYRFPPSPTLLRPHVLVELGRSIRIREEYSMDARLLEYPAPVSGGRLVWQLHLRRRRYVCARSLRTKLRPPGRLKEQI